MAADSLLSKSPGADVIYRHVMAEIERKLTLDFADQLQEAQIAIEIAEAKHDDWKAKVKEAIKAGKTAPQPPPPIPEEPIMPRLVPSDVTIERLAVLLARAAPKGVMMTRDELAGWLLGMTAYNDCARAFWIEAYGARPYRVDRVKHPEPIIIPRPAVSWHGGIQPERLAEVMQEADDDLLARFIWFWPEPVPFYIADAPPEIDWAVTCFDRLRMLDLVAGANGHQSLMVPLTADAVRRLEQSDWVALFRSLTVDTLDSVDTVSTAHADAGSLTADTFDIVDTVDEAPPSERQSLNSVQSVSVSEEEAGEATTSPLAAALTALERHCPDHIETADWQHAVEGGPMSLACRGAGKPAPELVPIGQARSAWPRLVDARQAGDLDHYGERHDRHTAVSFYRLQARQGAQKT